MSDASATDHLLEEGGDERQDRSQPQQSSSIPGPQILRSSLQGTSEPKSALQASVSFPRVESQASSVSSRSYFASSPGLEMPPFSPMGLRSPSKRPAMHRSSTQVEQVETMLDNLLDGPDPLDSKLNKLNFQKAKRKMLDALAEKDEITDGHDEELEDILMYKGRPVTACLLHFAVWCSARLHDSACVEAVLPYLTADDIFAK
ncbi:unnamed protein product, partial [Polarella glacialis]